MRRGNTAPLAPSPLPQENLRGHSTPVQVVNGFVQNLPGRSRVFFQRDYFAPYPRPIQAGAQPGFPVKVPIARIEVPKSQCIVFRTVEFQIFEHSGIGVDDIIPVEPMRGATFIGFTFKLGNRGLTDYNTNVEAPNVPVVFGGGNFAGATVIQGGSGEIYPFAGQATPDQPYAAYGRPGDLIDASAQVLRGPNFDIRFFFVRMSGWILGESELDAIISSLTT